MCHDHLSPLETEVVVAVVDSPSGMFCMRFVVAGFEKLGGILSNPSQNEACGRQIAPSTAAAASFD